MNAPAIATSYGEATHREGLTPGTSLLASLTGAFRNIIDREPAGETPSYSGEPHAISTSWQIMAYGPVYHTKSRALWD